MLERLRLRWQVVIGVGMVQLVALAACAAILGANARSAVEVEISASERSARALVLTAVGALMNEERPGGIISALADRLVQPRHVRLDLFDARTGQPVALRTAETTDERASAPEWFARLITPRIRETRLPIVVDGRTYGIVWMTTAPQDEIVEVWQDARALLWLGAVSFLASMLLLALVVGRALRPLRAIDAGLTSLGRGDRAVRVPDVRDPDLGPIAARVNSLAAALRQTEGERNALHRKVMELGDAERKAIAMELHDEFGPCLFGLKVKAGAIARAADAAGNETLRRDAEGVQSIVEQIQATNTRLLTTLRPMAIGQLPLPDAIDDLAAEFRARHPAVTWEVELPEKLPETDETLDLTVYRFFQEGVTNALRHGRPARLRIALGLRGEHLRLAVEDDGAGMSDGAAAGRGIAAMRDRIIGGGGTLRIGHAPGGGTRLEARLPLPAAENREERAAS